MKELSHFKKFLILKEAAKIKLLAENDGIPIQEILPEDFLEYVHEKGINDNQILEVLETENRNSELDELTKEYSKGFDNFYNYFKALEDITYADLATKIDESEFEDILDKYSKYLKKQQ